MPSAADSKSPRNFASETARDSRARFPSVMSCPIDEAPTMRPVESRIGAIATDAAMIRPSFRTPAVSKRSIDSPRPRRSRLPASSPNRSVGTRIENGLPTASAAVNPYMRSAPAFQSVIRASSVMPMIASWELSTMAARRAFDPAASSSSRVAPPRRWLYQKIATIAAPIGARNAMAVSHWMRVSRVAWSAIRTAMIAKRTESPLTMTHRATAVAATLRVRRRRGGPALPLCAGVNGRVRSVLAAGVLTDSLSFGLETDRDAPFGGPSSVRSPRGLADFKPSLGGSNSRRQPRTPRGCVSAENHPCN